MRPAGHVVRTLLVAVVALALPLAGCQTARGPAGPDAPPGQAVVTDGHPCAGGAPQLEALVPADFGGVEPPPEDMAWQEEAAALAGEVTALAGDRLAAVWLSWEPERSMQVRLTEGRPLGELEAAVRASGLEVDVRYDRTYSEAELVRALEDAMPEVWDVPGVAGASADTLGGRLVFDVAGGGDDGGAATCAAITAILAGTDVPFAFSVFDGPTEGTVREPVSFGEASLVGDRTLHLSVGSCNGEPEVTALEETDTDVRIEITSTVPAPGWPGEDCLDGLEVTLEGPLAGRTLIDMTSGDVVGVVDQG